LTHQQVLVCREPGDTSTQHVRLCDDTLERPTPGRRAGALRLEPPCVPGGTYLLSFGERSEASGWGDRGGLGICAFLKRCLKP
jgi:hypothetical protein